jgi:anti-sigma regulatory factor (Ser/Thr protein kinase)
VVFEMGLETRRVSSPLSQHGRDHRLAAAGRGREPGRCRRPWVAVPGLPGSRAEVRPAAQVRERCRSCQRARVAAAHADTVPSLLGDGCPAVTARAAELPVRHVFPGTPHQVSRVRDLVRRVLAGHAAVDDAVLMASELATNAVVHTASRDAAFTVLIYCHEGRARVEVVDSGAVTAPAVQVAGRDGESGSGLRLVQALACKWGYDGGPDGRVVWFEVETLEESRAPGAARAVSMAT